MKKLLNVCSLVILMVFTSCSLGDDDNGECVTGPVIIALDLVEEGTSENLFQNGTYDQDELTVVDNQGNEVEHNFIVQDGRPYLRIRLGNEVGDKLITLNLDDENFLVIEYTMAVTEGNCINYYVSDFDIPGYDFDQSGTTGVIRVYL